MSVVTTATTASTVSSDHTSSANASVDPGRSDVALLILKPGDCRATADRLSVERPTVARPLVAWSPLNRYDSPRDALRVDRAGERERRFVRVLGGYLSDPKTTVVVQHTRWGGDIDVFTWDGNTTGTNVSELSRDAPVQGLEALLAYLGSRTTEQDCIIDTRHATVGVDAPTVQLRHLYLTISHESDGAGQLTGGSNTDWAAVDRHHGRARCSPFCPGIPIKSPIASTWSPSNHGRNHCPSDVTDPRAKLQFDVVQQGVESYLQFGISIPWSHWRDNLDNMAEKRGRLLPDGRPKGEEYDPACDTTSHY